MSRRALLAGSVALLLAGCPSSDTPPSPTASPSGTPAPTASPPATPRPTPTPPPTPRFTNEPDPELAALIPSTAAGLGMAVPTVDQFGLTPGDVGSAFGEIGDRFATLVIAYVDRPRTTLYAVRVDGPPVATEELEPHLATAGRYVGIAGLDRASWQLTVAGGHLVWARPEDNATVAGTMIYTWASGEYVFLLIGIDDAINQEILAALPGEPPPSPSPAPSGSEPASPEASSSPSG